MPKICLYFQIHQPWRLSPVTVFDVAKNKNVSFENEELNRSVINKVAEKSYLPMLKLLNDLMLEEKEFATSISITGVALEQLLVNSPDVIDALKMMAETKQLEFLGETYYHSLASLYSPIEFLLQIKKHKELIGDLFGQSPKVFRNTELIYTNDIARMVMAMGYSGMLTEGADKILKGRRPGKVFMAPCGLPLLLKHYQLSDDIAFRFSSSSRSNSPLTADTFVHWINSSFEDDETVNLFMDFETFGEHQWADTGIFQFFYHFVKQFIASGGEFVSVSDSLRGSTPIDVFDSVDPVSWADVDRDITAWRGNPQQLDSLKKIYEIESEVLKSEDNRLIEDWRRLQTSDHYYYMCTKWSNDGDVHAYFSHYKSPYEAYVNFNNAYTDIKIRLNQLNTNG